MGRAIVTLPLLPDEPVDPELAELDDDDEEEQAASATTPIVTAAHATLVHAAPGRLE
jgi:hypothetical protein